MQCSIGESAATVSQRSRVRIPCKPEFFSGFIFATAKVASITAMIFFHIIATNCVKHKQTLPPSPKHFGTFDAGVLLEDKGLFPFFEPEIKGDQ